MFRSASSFASKVRWDKNGIHAIGSRLSWSRSYAAEDKFGDEEIAFMDCEQSFRPHKVRKERGTRCGTVLSQAICDEGYKALAAGVNAMGLTEGIRMAVDAVVSDIEGRAQMISTSEEIAQVGTISAYGDREIGELIAEAIKEVGKDLIIVSVGKNSCMELEFFNGMKLDSGYISSSFVNNRKKKICVLERPFIFIHDKKLSSFDLVMEIFTYAIRLRKPLLIVAEDVHNDVLANIFVNQVYTGTKVCVIKAPVGTRNACVKDLAILTNSCVVTEEEYINLDYPTRGKGERLPWQHKLGICTKVIVSKNDTFILGKKTCVKDKKEKYERLISMLEKISNEDTKERLTKQFDVYAVLKVGGAGKADVGEKKKIVTHALSAAKAAMEEGILPGGGVSLLYASKGLGKLQIKNSGQRIGVQIIQNALKMPVYAIASTAGVEGSAVVGQLLGQGNLNVGYDSTKGEYVDMIKSGIVDPVKVIRTEFVEAASYAKLAELAENEKEAP